MCSLRYPCALVGEHTYQAFRRTGRFVVFLLDASRWAICGNTCYAALLIKLCTSPHVGVSPRIALA